MIDEKKLEERLVALEAVKSLSPRVVSRLEMLLRSGTDEALYRINPIQFATEKSIAEAEGIDLFLHACVAGLFDMDWLLVCPMCSDVVESFRSLRKLHTHFHCDLCQCDYDAALDDYITDGEAYLILATHAIVGAATASQIPNHPVIALLAG